MKKPVIKLILLCAITVFAAVTFIYVAATGKKSAPAVPAATEAPMEESIVFFGDSITFMGDWQSYFPGKKVYNLGVSGDTVGDLIERIGGVFDRKPTKLFVMVGINDVLSGFERDDIIADWQELFGLLKDGLPGCRIYVQSLLPVDKTLPYADTVMSFNSDLMEVCRSLELEYIDLFPLFRDRSGYLMSQYTRDGLHLNEEAYALWAEEIRKLAEG